MLFIDFPPAPSTVEFLSRSPAQTQLKTDMARYWTLLTQVGYDPFTSYQSLLAHGPVRGSVGWGTTVKGNVNMAAHPLHWK